MSPPKVVLGTMTFGNQVPADQVSTFIDAFHAKVPEGELDTAYAYPTFERMNETHGVLASHKPKRLATKVNPWEAPERVLSPAVADRQLEASLQALQADSVDLLYLHAPSATVPLRDIVGWVGDAWRREKFSRFGLSNYAAWQVVEVHREAERAGIVLPTVYQGMYNCLTRAVEPELFPALRHLNMSFYAFNATCGGLLAPAYRNMTDTPTTGRFAEYSYYVQRFWTPEHRAAADAIGAATDAAGIGSIDAGHRWLAHHSKLDGDAGDAIIVGASKLAHLEANVASCVSSESLPAEVVAIMDEQWTSRTRSVCPPYFR
jgi:aflatoxin B1 aldehyde reductase